MTGYKQFADGVPLFASELNGYLMGQTVMRFPTTTAMRTALSAIADLGQLAWAANTAILYMWDGTQWKAVMSPEKPWSPTWTGSTTNPQKGTSTESGTYRVAGPGLIKASWRFLYNGTFVIGAGNYAWTLPVTCDNSDSVPLGQATFNDASAATYFTRTAATIGTTGSFALLSEAGVRSGAAAPAAPATGDMYQVELLYRSSALDQPA